MKRVVWVSLKGSFTCRSDRPTSYRHRVHGLHAFILSILSKSRIHTGLTPAKPWFSFTKTTSFVWTKVFTFNHGSHHSLYSDQTEKLKGLDRTKAPSASYYAFGAHCLPTLFLHIFGLHTHTRVMWQEAESPVSFKFTPFTPQKAMLADWHHF